MSEESDGQLDELPAKPVLLALGGALLFGGALVILSALLFAHWRRDLHPDPHQPDDQLMTPRTVDGVRQSLYALPPIDRLTLARRTLESWSWADQKRGLVRVPIERAIELELDKKLIR